MPTSSAAVTSAFAPAPLMPNGPMFPKMIPNFTGRQSSDPRRGQRATKALAVAATRSYSRSAMPEARARGSEARLLAATLRDEWRQGAAVLAVLIVALGLRLTMPAMLGAFVDS